MRWFLRSSGRIFTLSVKEGQEISLPLKDDRIRHVPTPAWDRTPGTPAGLARHGQGKKGAAVSAGQDPHSMCTRGDASLCSCGTKRGWGEKVKKFKHSLEKP